MRGNLKLTDMGRLISIVSRATPWAGLLGYTDREGELSNAHIHRSSSANRYQTTTCFPPPPAAFSETGSLYIALLVLKLGRIGWFEFTEIHQPLPTEYWN